MIKIIIFDQDGTLYNPKHKLTKELRIRTKKWISKKLNISPQRVDKIYKNLPKKYPNPLDGFESLGLSSKEYLRNVFDKTRIENFIKRDSKLIKTFENIKNEVYIVTIASIKYSLKLQSVLGIKKYIKKTFSLGEKYPIFKTKYQIYEEIRKSKKVLRKEILIIGDNYEVDLKKALSKGYNVAIVWNNLNKDNLINLKNIYNLKDYSK
jgi:FMN phosphatase YigB (HAD superfamily)